MKGVPFLLIVLIAIAIIYSWYLSRPTAALPLNAEVIHESQLPGEKEKAKPFREAELEGKEGFQSNGAGCNPIVVPMEKSLPAGAEPTLKPGALVAAPYGEVASTAPAYYRDPAMETASRERIATSAEQLRGFLSFEAPLMRGMSDPSVQLPLSVAKADLPRLEQELFFLQQNPGLQSSLKVNELDTVDSNIDYLQQKYRLAVNTGVIQRPVSFLDSGVSAHPVFAEGFTVSAPAHVSTASASSSHASGSVSASGHGSILRPSTASASASGSSASISPQLASLLSVPIPSSASASSILGEVSGTTGERASPQDLRDAIPRLVAERTRLSASGTNDPILNARITEITNIINDLQDKVTQLNNSTITPMDIHITKAELDNLFRTMQNTNQPLAPLTGALPPALSNLVPPGLARDSESVNIIRGLADKYLGDFLKGTSFEFNIGGKYTSDNEAAAATRVNITNNYAGTGLTASVANAFGPLATPVSASSASGFPTASSLDLAGNPLNVMPDIASAAASVSDPYAFAPQDGQRRPVLPSGFDWKERVKVIRENIRKRGLNPADFGCLPPNAVVSREFSWRGHARMVCERLQTNYYTGIAEACGCPPLNWPGWNSTVPPTPAPQRVPGVPDNELAHR